eukprot:TRINITY_DN40654_c0_g1_i1.p1 TRINITY_DN40654_c0_g1~~TRINITY_DN40654_c0_g1_i1.p1  ORF type:complete len:114 (+),score=35.15 TRINITY_DN40654_c0_g1_i1:66-407(+)
MIRRPPRSTLSSSSAASDVYKRQAVCMPQGAAPGPVCQESCHGSSIGLQTAQALRRVVLGPERQWDASWLQPLVFCEVDCLAYGLFQNKGGPCGVISALNLSLIHISEPTRPY